MKRKGSGEQVGLGKVGEPRRKSKEGTLPWSRRVERNLGREDPVEPSAEDFIFV